MTPPANKKSALEQRVKQDTPGIQMTPCHGFGVLVVQAQQGRKRRAFLCRIQRPHLLHEPPVLQQLEAEIALLRITVAAQIATIGIAEGDVQRFGLGFAIGRVAHGNHNAADQGCALENVVRSEQVGGHGLDIVPDGHPQRSTMLEILRPNLGLNHGYRFDVETGNGWRI